VATRPDSFWARQVEYLLLLVLLAGFVARGLIPAWRSLNTDFPNYYLAARLYRQGYPLDRVYDWVWFQRQKDHEGVDLPLVSFVPHPPACIFPVLPLSFLYPLAAKRWWLVFNLVLLGVIILLLNSIVQLGLRRVAIIVFLALDALRTNFLFGQEHLLIAFLLALATFFFFRGSTATAGATLACGAALKIYPALFLLYFLRKKQWRAIAGLTLCSLALGLVSLQVFGFGTLRNYALGVLPRVLSGELNDPYNPYWSSFTALLRRTFISEPELNPHPLIHLPAVYAVLQPFCQALLFVPALWLISSSRVAPAKEKLEWGTYVVLLLILSPNPGPYHFCALIVAGALAANYFLESASRRSGYLLLGFYALVCFPVHPVWTAQLSMWQTLQAYLRLGALTALWILLLWALVSSEQKRFLMRLRSRETAAFGCLMLTLVTVGVWTNLHHLRGLFANYAARLVVRPGSLFAAEPAVAGSRVVFNTMAPSGYTIASWSGNSLADVVFASDAFHPTASQSGEGWVELASVSSRIVEAALARLPFESDRTLVVAENAEQPAVSADAKWLAFIRENRGRGSLWTKELCLETEKPTGCAAESMVVGDEYNVLEAAFFPDDRVVFAAQPRTRAALFVLDLKTRRPSPLWVSTRAIRYPAVSPDGQWLAYSQDEGGNWQLWAMRFSTGEKRRLTGGECNSIAPAWYADSKTLVFATDCGRGVGLTALCRVQALP